MDTWAQTPTQASMVKTEEARDMDQHGEGLEPLVHWLVSPPSHRRLECRQQAIVPSAHPTILRKKVGGIPTHFTT